ncbi:c-type cytochrome [Labrys wisconsinensis]|nr:cytochrome c family protein [Labrys wisconsinensis]
MKRIVFAALAFLAFEGAARAQDVAAGEKVFIKCKACHQIGETAKNAVGPELNGLIGRHSGAVDGFNYSAGMKNSNLQWTEENLSEYLKSPKQKVPGNKMAFVGLNKPEDIANVLAYLKQFGPDGKKAP